MDRVHDGSEIRQFARDLAFFSPIVQPVPRAARAPVPGLRFDNSQVDARLAKQRARIILDEQHRKKRARHPGGAHCCCA